MKPIIRKELYLNKIVGNNDYETPEKPIPEEEFFFAEILGEAVQAPEPLPRYQMYLAKIAGKDVEIPYPETRLEYFLAKAAGMEIETPTPITREEIFWSNYHAIVDFEVEGIPPLTYKAAASALKDYKICGNTISGESVGDLITEGEHAGEYSVPATVTNGTDTETTNIYLPEQIKMVGDEAEYVDYKEQKQHRVRKNLLPNPATSQTINGVTFTVNSDGSVTCNGTATATAFFFWMSAGILPNNKRVSLTGCPSGGGASSYLLKMQIVGSPDALITDTGRGSITLFSQPIYPVLRIQTGYTCNNLTFYPMLRLASITDYTYEPYIKNTDLNVTLPALPTLSGTNILSIGTTVQPSKVYIKGEKEREYT